MQFYVGYFHELTFTQLTQNENIDLDDFEQFFNILSYKTTEFSLKVDEKEDTILIWLNTKLQQIW